MLKALITSGLSQYDIAIAIGVSQPTIHRALRGRQIIYETGKAIERLYESRCIDPNHPASEQILLGNTGAGQGAITAVQASSTVVSG